MGIETSADRHRQPAVYVDVVLQEHARNAVLIGEARLIARIERRTLERNAADPRLPWRGATHCELDEERILNVMLANVTSEIVFVFGGRGHASRQHVPSRDRHLRNYAAIESRRIERLGIRRTGRRQHRRWHRAATPLFPHRSAGGEQRAAGAVTPEHARTHDGSRVPRQVGPAVVVDVVALLPVPADEKRSAPTFCKRLRREQCGIGAASAGSIHERFPDRLFRRAARDQIDHAAESAGAVQRRRHALDHFHLSQVGWRNLQQAETADVAAEQWQPVGEKPRVAAAHALHAHARRPERG